MIKRNRRLSIFGLFFKSFANHLFSKCKSISLDFLSNIEKYCPIIADTTDIVAPYNDKAQPPFKYIQTFFFKSFANHLFSNGN